MIADGRTHGLRRRRGRGALIVLLGVLGVLLVAFFRLQVLRSSAYVLRSEENRLRPIQIPAPRGTITDRRGRVVAENVPGYTISLLPARTDTVAASLRRIAPYLGLGSEEREVLMEEYRRTPNRPLLVRDDATFEEVSVVEGRRPEFRRAVVEMRPRRQYPSGRAVAHLVGYVGEISEAELETPRFEAYEPGRIVGKDGIERQYEDVLGGTPGVRYVEVNALGSIVREFPRPAIPAEPGRDLQLGIDLALQEYADSIFPDTLRDGRVARGGAVALDPRTGEILLLYSHPSFDPNRFIGGIDRSLWRALSEDPAKPLLNRVTSATYAPGSTWKLVVSTIGMRRGTFGIRSRFAEACDGGLRYGNRVFRCWKPSGHGSLDLSGAIKNSCNVYFYQAGQAIGLDALTAGVERLGFNRRTGVDLPYENPGLFPSSREWYDRRYGERRWTESVVLNLSIGQGENQQTLLRQALFYGALATGEAPVLPHLLRNEALAQRRAEWEPGLPEARRRELLDALKRVVNEQGGTAYPYRLERWTLAGKTGTAQNPHGEPHSWFVGFAPADDPRIAIAAIVENGHPDNTVSLAVPFASRLVARYLEAEGVPPDRSPPAPAAEAVASAGPGTRTP